jgi:olefin beta-lactone synthetase
LYTIPCEAIFNSHPDVLRSALVGIGKPPKQKPAVCIQIHRKAHELHDRELERELLDLAAKSPITQDIDTIFFHPDFPVDIRHNAKIYREQLAAWVERKMR